MKTKKDGSASDGSESSEEEYVVEKIIDRRVKKGKVSDITTIFRGPDTQCERGPRILAKWRQQWRVLPAAVRLYA